MDIRFQRITIIAISFLLGLGLRAQYIEEHRFNPATARWFGKAKPIQDTDGQTVGSWETPAGIREIFGIRLVDGDPPSNSFDTISFDYKLSNPKAWFGLRITDYPLVDGFDAIWYLRNIPDNGWHSYTADISQPDNVWGEEATRTRRLLCWRVHSTKDLPTVVKLRNIVFRRFSILMRPLMDELQWRSSDTLVIPLEMASRLAEQFTGRFSIEGESVELAETTEITIESGETKPVEVAFRIHKPLPKIFSPITFKIQLLDGNGALASFTDVKTIMSYPVMEGPSLIFTNDSLEVIWKKLDSNRTLGAWWRDRFLPLVDSYLPQPLAIPTRGSQWPCHYICSKCGAPLKMKSPTEHVCTRCQTVHSGWPYDDCPLYEQHAKYAEMAEYLGIAYAITKKEAYAAKAKEILLKYAELYPTYPLHANDGKPKNGGGYAFSEALHEAIWHIKLTRAFDCVRQQLTDDERKTIARQLLLRFAKYVRTVNHGIHNHECWHLAGAGMVGFALGLPEYVRDAIHGQTGMLEQIRQGVTDDGPWFEGTWNYHFFTLQALEPFTIAAMNHGIDLRSDRYKSMYDAPFQQLTPTFELPAFHDSHRVPFTPETYGKFYEMAYSLWPSPLYAWWLKQSPRRNLQAILYGKMEQSDEILPTFSSALYPSAGYGVLRSRAEDMPAQMIPQNYLAIDFGPHGGWHGHCDKLNLVLWMRNVMFLEDSGCASYADPRDKEWYKATISHNTVMLDGKSQAAATGKCIAFAAGNNASIISCDAGPVYEDAVLQRHVALLDGIVLDMFTVCSKEPRDIAWLVHSRDEQKSLIGQPCAAPSLEGAKWAVDWHEQPHDGIWTASWLHKGQQLNLLQKSPSGRILSCRGMTTPRSAEYFCRFNQIHAGKAMFATILTVMENGKQPKAEITSYELFEDGSCTMRVIIDGRRLLFLHAADGKIKAGNISMVARTALLEEKEGLAAVLLAE